MARFSAVAVLAICCLGIATAEWVVVWEDDFNGGNLKDRWNFELGCSGKLLLTFQNCGNKNG